MKTKFRPSLNSSVHKGSEKLLFVKMLQNSQENIVLNIENIESIFW